MGAKKWTQAEIDLLRDLWKTDIRILEMAEMFPGRTAEGIYRQGKTLNLGARRVPQQIDKTLNWIRIAAQLESGPKTPRQIAIATSIDIAQVHVLLKRRRGRLCRISGYLKPKLKPPQQLWELGTGADAPRPPKKDRAQICREYTARLKESDPGRLEDWRTRKTAKEKTKPGGEWIKRDPAASWF